MYKENETEMRQKQMYKCENENLEKKKWTLEWTAAITFFVWRIKSIKVILYTTIYYIIWKSMQNALNSKANFLMQ